MLAVCWSITRRRSRGKRRLRRRSKDNTCWCAALASVEISALYPTIGAKQASGRLVAVRVRAASAVRKPEVRTAFSNIAAEFEFRAFCSQRRSSRHGWCRHYGRWCKSLCAEPAFFHACFHDDNRATKAQWQCGSSCSTRASASSTRTWRRTKTTCALLL